MNSRASPFSPSAEQTPQSAPMVLSPLAKQSQQEQPAEMCGMEVHLLSTRYSLVCHETRTKVMVGGDGDSANEMLSSLTTDEARAALCTFLMFNREHPLFLVAENWAATSDYPLYRLFGEEADSGDFSSMQEIQGQRPPEWARKLWRV